jgi:hypothetical protein
MGLMPAVSFAAPANVTSVTLTPPAASQLVAGNQVTFTASSTGAAAEYQFFWTGPNGSFHTKYRTQNTLSLTLNPGNYAVQVYALSKTDVAAHKWSMHKQSGIVVEHIAVPKATNVKISGPAESSLTAGPQQVNLTATATAPVGTTLYYQFVVQDAAGKVTYTHYSTSSSATVTLPAGVSTAWVNVLTGSQVQNKQWSAHVSSAPLTYNVAAYGAAAGITTKAAAASLAADGSATDTVTVTVVDAEGNTVADFNGTATVTDTNGLIADATTAGVQASDYSGTTLTITDGVGTVVLGPTSTIGVTDTINVVPSSSSGLAPSSTTVATVAPTVTALKVAVAGGQPSDLSANSQSYTDVVISTTDAQGNVVGSASGTYATLTLTGPGSFVSGSTPGSAVTSETVYIPAGTMGGSYTIPVYSVVGETGTVSVTATATGLTTGSVSIPSYLIGSPAGLQVQSSAGTDSHGNPYTLYTVTVVDSNGHPVPNASGTLSVTSNAATQGGAISVGTVSSAGVYTPGAAVTITNGVATFAVETTSMGTNPVTLTITDGTVASATASYNFVAEAAAKLSMTSPSVSYYTVKGGQSVTVSTQVTDSNGNPVADASVPVTFTLNGSGLAFPNQQNTYVVDTNASGVASVTLTAVSGSGGTATVSAAATGLTSATSGNIVVEPATDTSAYATSMSLSGTNPVQVTAGGTSPSITATAANGLGNQTGLGNDVFGVTSSNSSVVAVTKSTVTSSAGVATIGSDLSVGMAGTATITVTDLSNPSEPSATVTVDVVPGPASQAIVEYQGQPVSGLAVSANSPVQLTVVNADAAGDPIPVTGSTALTVDLSTASGVSGGFLSQIGGGPINSVQIQPGTASTTVYFESATAETLAAGDLVATPMAGASSLQVGGFTEGGTTAPYTYTATVTASNAYGGVTGLTASDFTVVDTTTNTTLTGTTSSTPSAGQFTVAAQSTAGKYTLTIYSSSSTSTDAISVTTNGVTGTGTL